MLLLNSDAESADIIKVMLLQAKKDYVSKVHPYAITRIGKGAKAGRFKTYVGQPRREVSRQTEKDLYEYLYDLYKAEGKRRQTFQSVFEERLNYLQMKLNRSGKTISDYRSIYNRFIPDDFGSRMISEIKAEDVQELVGSQCRQLKPKEEALKKAIQMITATFTYAFRSGYIAVNPALQLDVTCYYKDCDLTVKTGDQKEFSDAELDLLTADAWKHRTNPRALMSMMAKETGMRAGELTALHKEDIESGYIHIHRQQLIDESKKGPDRYYEVSYTKDERMHPHDGRRFPITEPVQSIIDLAEKIPGESDYLFHNPDAKGPIGKDTYEQYLSRRCAALGIRTTNNHAFRMAVNSRFISQGLSPAERALLLGHAVQTNERHYSLTDKRQLSALSEKLLSASSAECTQKEKK